MSRKYLVLVGAVLMLALMVGGVHAGGRINMVHHFGGDALFCDLEDGCRALNMDGDLLWAVDQATIDAAMAAACESGVAQNIEAGQGTYGPMVIEANCYGENGSMLKLIGYDEHGKQNEMPFAPNYAPVNAPVSHDEKAGKSGGSGSDLCAVYIGFPYSNWPMDNVNPGWDVWEDTDDSGFLEPYGEDTFLYFTESDPGYSACVFSV